MYAIPDMHVRRALCNMHAMCGMYVMPCIHGVWGACRMHGLHGIHIMQDTCSM